MLIIRNPRIIAPFSKINTNASDKTSEIPDNSPFIKLSKFKIDQTHQGYLIYDYDDSRKFFQGSAVITSATLLSIVLFYLNPTVGTFMPFGLSLYGWYSYFARMTGTLRRVVIDK